MSINPFNNLKITWKLILMVTLCGFIPMFTLGFLAVKNTTEQVQSELYKSNTLYTSLTHREMAAFFKSRENEATILANSKIVRNGLDAFNRFDSSIDTDAIESEFTNFIKTLVHTNGYTDIFITNTYQEVIFSFNYNKLDLAPLAISGDFVEKSMAGQQNWSDVFRNSFIDDNIMVLSTPVYSDPSKDAPPIGAVNLVLNQASINTIVAQGIEIIGETGQAYIIDQNGEAISKEPYNMNYPDLTQAVKDSKLDYKVTHDYRNINGDMVLGTHSVLMFGDAPVGFIVEVQQNEAFKGLNEIRLRLILITLAMLMVSLVGTLWISRGISAPIKTMILVADEISDFNLKATKKYALAPRKDELGHLQSTFHKIEENFNILITDIEISSKETSSTANTLNDMIQESISASEILSNTIKIISESSSEQSQNANECLIETDTLTETLTANTKTLQDMDLSAQSVMFHVTEGLSIMDALSDINDTVALTNKNVQENLHQILEDSHLIEDASFLISEVSKRTNLLSLNASIEAARAGEYGKGFSVVAEEIKALSNQSRELSEKIKQMVQQQNLHNQTIDTQIKQLITISEKQFEIVEKTKFNYSEINTSLDDVKTNIHESRRVSEKIDESRLAVYQKIKVLAAKSEDNHLQTKKATDAIEAQNRAVLSTSIASQALNTQSEKLMKHLITLQQL